MLYLLWGLLNIGLFLFFVTTCFRATKLAREKLGLFASIIFVFGLLSFIFKTNTNKVSKGLGSLQIRTWTFAPEDSLDSSATYVSDTELEKTLISKYGLYIEYGKNKQRKLNIPISAYSLATGFVSGTNWKPLSIIINQTNDNHKFQYYVYGTIEWELLGATVYSQPKEYKGLALVK